MATLLHIPTWAPSRRGSNTSTKLWESTEWPLPGRTAWAQRPPCSTCMSHVRYRVLWQMFLCSSFQLFPLFIRVYGIAVSCLYDILSFISSQNMFPSLSQTNKWDRINPISLAATQPAEATATSYVTGLTTPRVFRGDRCNGADLLIREQCCPYQSVNPMCQPYK